MSYAFGWKIIRFYEAIYFQCHFPALFFHLLYCFPAYRTFHLLSCGLTFPLTALHTFSALFPAYRTFHLLSCGLTFPLTALHTFSALFPASRTFHLLSCCLTFPLAALLSRLPHFALSLHFFRIRPLCTPYICSPLAMHIYNLRHDYMSISIYEENFSAI